MYSRMLSLENISAVKSAVCVSLSPEVKKEILCVPGSEYDVCKLHYQYYRKEQWLAIVERKAKEVLKRYLPEILQDKVIRFVPAIAFRILIWAAYHEGILGLTCYYSLNFLGHSHFTSQGVIDDKKAAEDMIMDLNLRVEQRYKLACIYCFPKYISSFFKKIVRNKKSKVFGPEDSKWMEKPEIVKYWTCQMTGMVDEYNKHTPRYLCRLEKSIKSGSKEAVKFFWKETCLISRENSLIYGATEVLNRINERSDWIVFRDKKFDDSKESWVPNHFYIDILCFFLSNMTETQQQKALEKNIQNNGIYTNKNYGSTVLELFLFWPYQDYFMKIAVLLWGFMPEKTYAIILLKICDKIEPCKRKNLLYGEEKSYDYKKLLIDFWSQSPNHFKRYVFQDRIVIYNNGVGVGSGIGLLLKLISMKKFTYENEEIVSLILGSATSEERAYLTSGKSWTEACISILEKEKIEIFSRLLKVLCKSEEEIRNFKQKLDLYHVAKIVCYYFLSYNKVNAVKLLINLMSLPEHQMYTLKENIIFSKEGMNHCQKLLSSGRNKDFEEFIKWFLPSKKREIIFKKHLASKLNEKDLLVNHYISSIEAVDFISSFTRSKLPDTQAIKGIQTSIADMFGLKICEDLIAGSPLQVIYEEKDSSVRVKTDFNGGQWEKVDEFLSWSLPNKKRVLEFKKAFFKKAGDNIHYKLIKAKQWKEAKRFFDWLGLPVTEIKALKERALFKGNCWLLLHYLVFDHDDKMSNLEEMDILIRWHLTDKETVIKFRDVFFDYHEDYDEVGLKKFNMLIENYLNDLDQEDVCQTCGNADERFFRHIDGGCLKRKFSVFLQQKNLRLSTDGEEILQNKKTVN